MSPLFKYVYHRNNTIAAQDHGQKYLSLVLAIHNVVYSVLQVLTD